MNYNQKTLIYPMILLSLLFLIPFKSNGQIQVSHVENYKPDDDYPRKGFMKIGDEEYYIAQGKLGTKVWIVDKNELKFLHELQFRPTDSDIDLISNFTYDNNSNFIYDGSILFEFYDDYVYLIDIIKGEIVEIVDLKIRGIKFPTNFNFGKNYFHFDFSSKSGWRGTVRYDRKTKQFEIMSFTGIFHDSKLYNCNQEGFIYLDLESNKTHQIKLQNPNIIDLISIDSDPNIHFVFQDSLNIYRLLADNTIDTLACSIPKGSEIMYYCNKRIVYGLKDGDILTFCIKDLSTCGDVFCEEFQLNDENNFIRIEETKGLYDDYFIIYEYRGLEAKRTYYLYDIKNNLKRQISTNEYPYFFSNTLRENNNFYYTLSKRINDRFFNELYKLNLETIEITSLIKSDGIQPYTIILSDIASNENINISHQYWSGYALVQLNEKEGVIKEIYQQDVIDNVGIQPEILSDLWVENKYFVATCDAVYVIEENKSTKILELSPYRCIISDFIKHNDDIYLLAGIEDTSFMLKIDLNTLNHIKIRLPETFQIGVSKFTANHLLVNYPDRNVPQASPGFFDLNVDKYIPIDSLHLPSGRIIQVSGANVLYLANNLYLIDPVKNKILPTNIRIILPEQAIPDNKGGFYLNANNKFSYLNSDGQLFTILDNFNYTYFRSGKNLGDNMQSFAFYDDKEVVIVIIKNGEVRKKVRSIDNSFYDPSFVWYESENFSFIETLNGQSSKLFYYTFDTEPKLISTRKRDQSTKAIMENRDHIVFAYKVSGYIFQFDKFDFKTLTVSTSLKFQPGFCEFYGPAYPLNEKEYLLSFKDGTHGFEPWVYNIESHKFEMLDDIRSGFLPSYLNDISIHPLTGDVYFTAMRTEGDRQLFKILNQSVSTENVQQQKRTEFSIYPVPASDFIVLDLDFENINITGIEGKIISNLSNYKKGEIIDLRRISNGLYFLSVTQSGQLFNTKGFIISK